MSTIGTKLNLVDLLGTTPLFICLHVGVGIDILRV